MGLDAMLNVAQATGRKCRVVSGERMAELLDYFDSVEVHDNDDN